MAPRVPRGIERTWPHVLTVEAVQGGEFYNGYTRLGIPESVRPHEPSSLVTLPFTRNVVGSMDFTPVLFSSTNRLTSEGFELGTAVVYEIGAPALGRRDCRLPGPAGRGAGAGASAGRVG